MQNLLGEHLEKLKRIRIRRNRMLAILLVLSLTVSLDVFWVLRQPGLTLAGDATCGITEHTHDDGCWEQKVVCECLEEDHVHEDTCYTRELTCGCEEHTHSIQCYADETADVETQLDWQNLFADYPFTGDLRKDLVGIARTQVGYRESEWNFTIDDDGNRHGYTRYGAWYGAPYGDWSGMFVSFCLHYAGADPEETPGNTGANSMATAWDRLGRYAAVDVYQPVSGDLVFFKDNTVGIVSEVQDATFYVIRGDVEDAVCGAMLPLQDDSVAGWGLTAGTVLAEETDPEPTQMTEPVETTEPEEGDLPQTELPTPTEADLLDISDGPAVFIFVGEQKQPQMQRFALRTPRTVTDLLDYLVDKEGTFFFTLLDTNNKELQKDESGNLIVISGTNYKLTFSISSPDGFAPGTYQYQLPDGMQVHGGTGQFILQDGTNVGSWEVSDDGLITMVFNEKMNNQSNVTISATMGVVFPVQDDPLVFDGNIKVTVEKPPPVDITTKLNKWGKQGAEGAEQNKTDPTKLYWTIEMIGQAGSQIPGSVITDQLIQGEQSYTQSDMDKGIEFGVSERDPVTGQEEWHSWTVYPGDPNLTWTETGWTYTIPEKIRCWCGEVTLGNENWTYYVNYTSTPEPLLTPGSFWYKNSVTVDGKYHEGWGEFSHGETEVGVVKTGTFHSDADGGKFLWEFQATVPGRKEGERAAYYTQIMDQLRVKDGENGTVAYIANDADKATVTAVYNGQIITVPHVENATEADLFAWVVGWTSEHNGISYTKALLPLCRCNCTEQTCHYWDGDNHRCGAYHYLNGEWGAYPSGFCYCWTQEQDITFIFSYETNAPEIIEAHGGQGKNLQNEVALQHKVYQPDGTEKDITLGSAVANVPIPGVFKKQLTHDFDGYTANYLITVNESKLALTDGSPLTIHDEMSQTLAYISGSLVITAEDADGKTVTLRQDVDYTVTYDGTGKAKDENGAPVHVLDIVILHPQPVMYVLDYDTTLVIPPGTTQAVKYDNSATITLWGEDITDESEEKVYADINIAAESYRVQMYKTDSQTDEPLGGATFGLFNAQGGLIATDETDSRGELDFETNVIEGIILREHVLYYLQELKAPPGYQLDDTKHWFCFCNSTADTCETCDAVMEGVSAFRIPIDRIEKVHVVNELMHYDLPATGGPGIYPIILVSVMCILTPLVYIFIRRRKQERRGVG